MSKDDGNKPNVVIEDAFSSAARTFASPVRLPAHLITSSTSTTGSSTSTTTSGTTTTESNVNTTTSSVNTSSLSSSSLSSSTNTSSSSSSTDDDVIKRVTNDKAVMRQLSSQQAQALRAIAHRAAADMEQWRTRAGAQQAQELLLYWDLWAAYMDASRAANERILQYLRTCAQATILYATTLNTASQQLTSISNGELLDLTTVQGLPNSSSSSSSNNATASTNTGTIASGARVAASRQGHDATNAGRNALSISLVTASVQELQTQVHSLVNEVGTHLYQKIIGDEITNKNGTIHAIPKKLVFNKNDIDGSKPPPTNDFASMVAWYDMVVSELKKEGTLLAETLVEGDELCTKAYNEFAGLTHAMMTGDRKFIIGKDLWLAELKYRRVARGLLAVKQAYLTAMAGIYEKYRKFESVRTESIASALDSHAATVAKLYDRVSSKTVVDMVKALNTHTDFGRTVEEEARVRIAAMREALHHQTANNPPQSSQSNTANAGTYQAYHATALGGTQQQQQQQQGGNAVPSTNPNHVHFTLEPAPAVITPFASPLVIRTGLILRQVGIMKTWKQSIGVLTRDAQLHLLTFEEDLGTHPDVLNTIFRTANGGIGYGGSAAHVQAMSAAAVEAGTSTNNNGNLRLPLPPSLGGTSTQASTDPLVLPRKAGTPPGLSFELTNTTKLSFAPNVHMHAFELSDSKGWFSSNKLILRAMNQEDMVDWICAINHVIDTISPSS